MPKTIDYPRTSYIGAWEVAEVVDDTGGKCALETCARKLNRKVSGSFKAIIGSAVKFGLLTSKRELLTTTNLFRRIKHAYDKQEEKIFHREAFLHPPLFTQICRKFRNRELPVHMFDVMLIREFGVEEINAQNVSKAFVDGARMVGILDERNVVADIDQLAQQQPRRELASTEMPINAFRSPEPTRSASNPATTVSPDSGVLSTNGIKPDNPLVPSSRTRDAISSLFGLDTDDLDQETKPEFVPNGGPANVFTTPDATDTTRAAPSPPSTAINGTTNEPASTQQTATPERALTPSVSTDQTSERAYAIRINGPGIDTQLQIQDADDLEIVGFLLEKIRKQLTR
ncbi:hypothetical protein [Hymenobacter sp. BT491]|uniref:hypothetical protein n=1 Tax=Hymenobacter sp. BT491 TaxID=2766779 RepID=UPI001653816C|nr:hypothetical protein [Hymenobacter sp. BT491]MBC6989935.1 hypothetical protein [Hymenobacter sp. BT491]